jgi:SPP1 gp7 family putative phage head morphogenesis protein
MDEKHFYDKTIRHECNFIAGVLNDQLWTPLGLRMEFKLDTMDVFQTDEHQRAGAFRAYVDAGLKPSLVAEMLGLELPDGWEYADLDPDEPEPQPVPPELAQPSGSMIDDAEEPGGFGVKAAKALLDDLRAWRRKSKKAGRLADFESYAIPAETMDAVRSADDWLAALDAAIEQPVAPPVKAQVEPDRAAEEALRRKLQAVLQAQRARVAQAIADGEEIDWNELMAELRAVMTPALAAAATQQAVIYAAALNIPLDIAKVNVAAWAWATSYSYELIKGITDTTQALVSQVTAQFIATPGMTVGDIVAALEPTFGPVRAQMIAVTETTRAYSQANRVTQEMLREMGIETVLIWQTEKDDKVCDICGPLDGLPEPEWGGVGEPPAHVNCRCWTTSKVVRRG